MLNNKLKYEDFCKNFIDGGYYEFIYKNIYINVGVEIKGFFHKRKEWIFIVHKHDNTGPLIFASYKTPELLLENACIFGKTLYEIWDDLEINP